MESNIQPILDRALAGERLTPEDCTALLESRDFTRIGLAAYEIRLRKNPSDVVTYIIERFAPSLRLRKSLSPSGS